MASEFESVATLYRDLCRATRSLGFTVRIYLTHGDPAGDVNIELVPPDVRGYSGQREADAHNCALNVIRDSPDYEYYETPGFYSMTLLLKRKPGSDHCQYACKACGHRASCHLAPSSLSSHR